MDTPFLPARYRLIRTLGEGGVGRVLLCDDSQRGIRVAIKLLAPVDRAAETEDDWARRLIEEARILARLDHPNIVGVLDAGKLDSGRPYLVFDYVEGTDLAHILEKRGPLDFEETLGYLEPVVSALGHAHAHGIIHRDVKPANVLVRAADGQPVLADFGCARSADRSIKTQAGIVLGTPGFVAPEVLTGEEPIPASDLYGVGCILYEALVGKPPFSAGSAAELLIAHLRQAVPASGQPRPIDRLIQRSLAKAPHERFPDAAAMSAAFAQTRLELERGGAPRGSKTRIAVASRDTAASAGVTRPISRGDVTIVGKSERIDRGARRIARQAQVARVALSVLMVGAALWIGLTLRGRSLRAATVHPSIVLDARGSVKMVWESIGDTRCCLTARPLASAAAADVPLERCEEKPARAHELVLEGLAPGGAYEVSLRTVEGDAVFTRHIGLPDVADVRVMSAGAERTRVLVKAGDLFSALELLRGGDGPLKAAARTEDTAEFGLPLPRTLVPAGWEVCMYDAHGTRYIIPVVSGADAVKRVLARLRPDLLESAYRDLTAAEGYFARAAHPVLPGKIEPVRRTIADRAAEARRSNGQAPGGYALRVRTRLEAIAGMRELLDLADALPAFFDNPQVEPALKRELYQRLRLVEWADRLCVAQFDAPTFNVGRWYAPLVKFEHALSPLESVFKDASPIIGKSRSFVDAGVNDPAPFELLRQNHPGWALFYLGARAVTADTLAAAAQPLTALATMYPQFVEKAGLHRRQGRVEVRARVALLEPTHTLEVTFRGKNEGDVLTFDLGQPGKDAWRQAMDGLLPDGQYAAAATPDAAVLFGEISAQFNAALLPADELNLEVRYRHVPGVEPSRLTGAPRFATLGSMRMRVQ